MARLSGDSSILGRIGFLLFDMLREFITVLLFLIRMFQVDFILALVSLTVMPSMLCSCKEIYKEDEKIRED